MIGRADVNDLEAILAVTNTDRDAVDQPRAADTATSSSPGTTTRAPSPRSRSSTRRPRSRSGTARPTSRGRPRSTRRRSSSPTPSRTRRRASASSTSTSPARRSRSGPTRSGCSSGIESQNWTLSQFMHGEQGALDLHRQDRRDRAVDRRQVLRLHPGDGRGPPRRGVRQVPRHQAVGPLPGQHPPEAAARRHRRRTAAGT